MVGLWRRVVLTGALLLLSFGGATAKNSSVVYQRRVILGLPVNVITVNLNDPK